MPPAEPAKTSEAAAARAPRWTRRTRPPLYPNRQEYALIVVFLFDLDVLSQHASILYHEIVCTGICLWHGPTFGLVRYLILRKPPHYDLITTL